MRKGHDRRRCHAASPCHRSSSRLEALRRHAGAGGRFAGCDPRRAVGDRRRKRGRQKHTDENPVRRDDRLRRRNSRQRPQHPLSRHPRRRASRHRHHSPGAEPGRAVVGLVEYFSRPRAADVAGPGRSAGHGCPFARAARTARMPDRPARAGGAVARRRSAIDRNRQGAVPGHRRVDHGRADQRTDRVGSGAAVSRDRAAAGPRRDGALHLAQDGRGVPPGRSNRGAARRAAGRCDRAPGDRSAAGDALDGRPGDRRDRRVRSAALPARWCWRSNTCGSPGRDTRGGGDWRIFRSRCGAAKSWALPG